MSRVVKWIKENSLFLGIAIMITLAVYFYDTWNLGDQKKIEINQAFELTVPKDIELYENIGYGSLTNNNPNEPIQIYYECALVTNPILVPENEFIQNKEWSYREIMEQETDFKNERDEEPSIVYSKSYKDKLTNQWVAIFYLDTIQIKVPVELPEEYDKLSVITRFQDEDELRLILPKNEMDTSLLAGIYLCPIHHEEKKMSLSLVVHSPNKAEIDLLKKIFYSLRGK